MSRKQDNLKGSLFTVVILFVVGGLITPAPERVSSGAIDDLVGHEGSELIRDQQWFATDVGDLRKSLRGRSPEVQIARLRYRVRQDWRQITLDRGQPPPGRWDQSPKFVDELLKQDAKRG